MVGFPLKLTPHSMQGGEERERGFRLAQHDNENTTFSVQLFLRQALIFREFFLPPSGQTGATPARVTAS
jgi:hypothetical protein